VSIAIAASVIPFITTVYLFRLIADARKVQARFRERPVASPEDVQREEEPLLKLEVATWTAPHFCEADRSGTGCGMSFYASDIASSGAEQLPS
jgi:hypothetical protein